MISKQKREMKFWYPLILVVLSLHWGFFAMLAAANIAVIAYWAGVEDTSYVVKKNYKIEEKEDE